jgi:hypothetical protein
MSDWSDARTSTLQHTTLTRHIDTYMPPAGFEHAVPISEGPQTLDRMALGIGEYVTVHNSLRE